MTSRLRVATFNANSIRARLDQVLAWLERNSPDILGLQETKVQDSEFPAEPFRSAGWQLVYRGQKAHGGVALLSREAAEEVAYGLDDEGPSDEHRLLRARVRGIAILNTYVPQGRALDAPDFAYKLHWFERLRALCARHYRPDEPLLWMGDLNVAPEPIDIYDPKGLAEHVDYHPMARRALESVREWGFVDVFRRHHPNEPGQYSYWDYRARDPISRGVGWRVDHIWATLPLAERSVDAWIDVEARKAERPSDHTFLVADFEL